MKQLTKIFLILLITIALACPATSEATQAIFLVEVVDSNFALPPLVDPDGGLQLQWDDGGVWRGGWSAIGLVPQMDTALVLVESSEAVIELMDDSDDYEFVELIEVEEEEEPTKGVRGDIKDKKIKVDKVKEFLKDRGHDEEDVEEQDWNEEEKHARKSLCILNHVTDEEYIRAGGKL